MPSSELLRPLATPRECPPVRLPPVHTLGRNHAKHGLPCIAQDGHPMSDTADNRAWLALWLIYSHRNEPRAVTLYNQFGEPYGIRIDPPETYGRPLARQALRALRDWYYRPERTPEPGPVSRTGTGTRGACLGGASPDPNPINY